MRDLLLEIDNLRAILNDYEDTFLDDEGFVRLNNALVCTYEAMVRYLNK